MKLYYAPGACSLAPHIVSREAGIALTFEKVDTKTKRTANGADFLQINPKGYVPALELDSGELLTEGPVISQYLADLAPASGLVPAHGSLERYRMLELLGYINSELHKSYSPLFNPASSDELRSERKTYLSRRYELIEQRLLSGEFLFGAKFTIADAYLFTVTNWAKIVGLDLTAFPALLAFQRRVAARPAVRAAMVAEGLVPAAEAA